MKEIETDILDLLPQRPPFLLVDRLVHFDPKISVTRFEVKADNPLVNEDCLSEAGLMENIAQSCAARIGYMNLLKDDVVRIGMIGSVKDLEIAYMPRVGSRLETTVEVVSEVFGITLVSATVMCGERLAASCQMKISLTDKVAAN